MKWKVGTKIASGFAVTLLIFLIVGFISWRTVQRSTEDAAWVSHTHRVLAELARLMSALQDVETGQRGYLITGDESYLAPYHAAISAVEAHRLRLAELVNDDPRQAMRVQSLAPLIAEKLRAVNEGLDARRSRHRMPSDMPS